MKVLVDTSAWLALQDGNDGNHRAAKACWEEVEGRIRTVLVTTWILSELATHLSRRVGPDKAAMFGRWLLDSPRILLVRGDPGLESRALLFLKSRGDPGFSFADAASWIVAREHGADAVFAFDRHLRIPGVRYLADGPDRVRERRVRYRAGPRRIRRISSITARHSSSEL